MTSYKITFYHTYISEKDETLIIFSDARYNTISVDTTDTILIKVGIDTTNPAPRYQYFHMIFKLIQKWFYTLEQESCVAGPHKDLHHGSKCDGCGD